MVSGPADELAIFRAAALGPGAIPWGLTAAELEEGWFNQLVAAPADRRGISVEGAHILARQLVMAVQAWHADIGPGRDCLVPLDLHALLPVPAEVLLLGPEAHQAEAWLWEHWGTTWPLRQVAEEAPGTVQQRRLPPDQAAACYRFYSADWSPWRALAHMRVRWPGLRFELRPDYGITEFSAPARSRRSGTG